MIVVPIVLARNGVRSIDATGAEMPHILLWSGVLIRVLTCIAGMTAIYSLRLILWFRRLDILHSLGQRLSVWRRAPPVAGFDSLLLRLGFFVPGGAMVILTAAATAFAPVAPSVFEFPRGLLGSSIAVIVGVPLLGVFLLVRVRVTVASVSA